MCFDYSELYKRHCLIQFLKYVYEKTWTDIEKHTQTERPKRENWLTKDYAMSRIIMMVCGLIRSLIVGTNGKGLTCE